MAFTTLAVIKKHLLSSGFNRLLIEDLLVPLNGMDETELPHHGLVEKSEAVKLVTEIIPTREGPVQLSGTEWYDLSQHHLLAESAIITLSDALGTVYTEEIDFQVDIADGRIRRVATGSIPNLQPVLIFYLYYSAFEPDTDYVVDCVRGTLRRTAGSAIPDGANVRVDYTVESGSITDELILQVMDDVQDRIVRALAPGYTGSSTDYGLQTGATLLVLAALARALAVEQLSRRLITDSAERAREWQKLVDSFEAQGWRILRPFLDPYQIHSPEKVPHA